MQKSKGSKNSKTIEKDQKTQQIKQSQQLRGQADEQHNMSEQSKSEQQSSYSSEDEDGKLLTNKVQQKLLTIVAKIRNKDPEIYKVDKPIFEQNDFEAQLQKQKNQKASNNNLQSAEQNKKNKKLTYQDLAKEVSDDSDSQKNKNDNIEDIRQNFKKKLTPGNQQTDEELFTIKKRVQIKDKSKSSSQKLNQLASNFSNQSSGLLNKLWGNEKSLDKTDMFLKNYILNQRWKSSKLKQNEMIMERQKQQMIDQEDQQRSVQMDQYEANYNFRFQQPGSDKIVQYPRQIPQSMRQMPETRKQKRKRLAERKKLQQEQIIKETQKKKEQKKQQILNKISEINENKKQGSNQDNSDFEHDWFFCDDCAKALEEKEQYYVCNQCGQYMLCQDCFGLIIHKHKMETAVIPVGYGPPPSEKAQRALSQLKSCKGCRKKIPKYLKHYEYNEGSKMVNILCERCYDQSTLQIKKKFHEVQPQQLNYDQMLQKHPQQIKQLYTQKDIQELVDQYLKYDFQDVIGGGLKTKFKYINVKPQGYGLSDEQILYGDDKQLNKYVSIKKLGAYSDDDVKLRNNQYNKKIRGIKKSAAENKKLVNRAGDNTKALRTIKKIKTRAQLLRKRRENRTKKLKIINISNQEDQKKLLLRKSRLSSYGLQAEDRQNVNSNSKRDSNSMEKEQ